MGNLAPFSYFNVMSHNPPHVAIGFAASSLRPHGRKDTLVNILETGWAQGGWRHAVGCFGGWEVKAVRLVPIARPAVVLHCFPASNDSGVRALYSGRATDS